MNADVNANPSSAPGAETLGRTRPFAWSVRRELWENSSIYVAPLAVACVMLLGSLIGPIYYGDRIVEIMAPVLALDPAKQAAALIKPYDIAAVLLMLTGFFVAVFYCLDALHGERRERTILFWKSLPVSDFTTVLSKASIPLAVLPLVVFATTVVTQLVMLLIGTVALATHGISASLLWSNLPLAEMALVLLYGLAVNSLWFAPVYGWLLLVSAWAKRSTVLWAVLPPIAVSLLEAIAFHTSHFASMLKYRFAGAYAEAFVFRGARGVPHVGLADLDPMKFLGSPGLWLGLLVAAAFIAAAVRLRRYREPL